MAVVWLEGWTGEAEESCRLAIIFSDWESSVLINQLPCLVHMLKLAISLSFGRWSSTWTVARARGRTSGGCPCPPSHWQQWHLQLTVLTRPQGKQVVQSSACKSRAPRLPLCILVLATSPRRTTWRSHDSSHAWTLESLCTLHTTTTPKRGPTKGAGPTGECRDSGAGALGSQSTNKQDAGLRC
jgi:hypothetical protein